jgi:hypothetical protein
MEYLFGMWDSINSFIKEGQEGLMQDRNGNPTTRPNYVGGGSAYNISEVTGNPSWYEVDTTKPLDDQLDITKITRYVNQNALTNYQNVSNDIKSRLDLGGSLEKDRLKATEDATGIFSFGLAAPTLYRLVEWYIEEVDELANLDTGVIEDINGTYYYRGTTSKSSKPKQYVARRQQKGTYEMLKNVPSTFLIPVGDRFFAANENKAFDKDGKEYTLKYGTKTKKIYLKRPKKGGEPDYVDVFVIAGGLADLDSMGMMAKVTPIIMLAEQLEQAGSKVRVYGLRAYNTTSGEQVYYSWVAKDYGAPIDLQAISTAIADPRFFRWAMWQNSEGISRKRYGKEVKGYGSTLYLESDYRDGFAMYKNYLLEQKRLGVNKTKVKSKELFIVGGLGQPYNDFDANKTAIEQEFYRISDIAEILLASKPENALRRIIKREKEKNQTNQDIRDRLQRIITQAFFTKPAPSNPQSPYYDSKIDVEEGTKRMNDILDIINRLL